MHLLLHLLSFWYWRLSQSKIRQFPNDLPKRPIKCFFFQHIFILEKKMKQESYFRRTKQRGCAIFISLIYVCIFLINQKLDQIKAIVLITGQCFRFWREKNQFKYLCCNAQQRLVRSTNKTCILRNSAFESKLYFFNVAFFGCIE